MSVTAAFPAEPAILIRYGADIEEEIARIEAAIRQEPEHTSIYNPRWLAIQLLENDPALLAEVQGCAGGEEVLRIWEAARAHLRQHYGDDLDWVVADYRYGFVHSLVRQVLTRTIEQRITSSDRIDRIVMHRVFGIPIFLFFMWVVFKVTTDVVSPYTDWLSEVVHGPLTKWVLALLHLTGLRDSWLQGLVVDGIIGGVGGVVVFIPMLMVLYLMLAFLEDTGYMARGAFVMDNLMHALGLHGKSFLPMLLGFGCTVPALYATRTLDSPKDRFLTGLLVPFMSCGARLPVYVLFAFTFFPEHTGQVIFLLYLTGVLVAVLLGVLFKNTVFRHYEESLFVIELPPYRMPSLRSLWFHMWEHISSFLRRIVTVVLIASVVVWFLTALPVRGGGQFGEAPLHDSAFAFVAEHIAPVLRPLGFGSWENSGALLSGLVAKEVIISTLAQVHQVGMGQGEEIAPRTFFQDLGAIGLGFIKATFDALRSLPLIVGINLFSEEDDAPAIQLTERVRENFARTSGGHEKLAAVAFMVFVLLYTPCIVATTTGRHELGIYWLLFAVFGQLSLAWLVAFVVFQGGLLLDLG